MFLEGFGEVITNILTVNPELSGVESASAILDTSNYTFNAITYGKDAEGFNFHAHSVSTIQTVDGSEVVSGYNDDQVLLVNYGGTAPFVSSYSPSSTKLQFSSTYQSVPAYPAPNHSRLELTSTQTTNASAFSATPPNLGHYPNTWIDTTLSNAWTIVGGFAPPSGAGKKFYVVNSAGAYLTSGVLSGIYNEYSLADKNGYVKISEVSGAASATIQSDLNSGPLICSGGDLSAAKGTIGLAVVPQQGDAVTLALYGGVNHIGVYCLDLNAMLASGITPPYSWDALNNNRVYKLVSKVSFWDNLLIHEDVGSTVAGLETGYNAGTLTNKGPTFLLKFNFK